MCRGQAVNVDYININKVLKTNAQYRNDRILCKANEEMLTNVPNNPSGKIKVP